LRIYRFFTCLLLLLVLPAVALGGYPDPEKLAREMERLEDYLKKAQAAEGPECAPESLAAAQSHLARAKEEFEEKDFWEAEDAIRLCEKEAEGIWAKILICGRDVDRDGIPDRKDKCKTDPETYNNYMDDDGCPDQIPRMAVLTGDKIEILVPVLFDDDTQRPLAESYAVLDEVARIMKENPGLRFRIQAHLDDSLPPGQADYITQQRARSTRDVLVYLGVPDDRLEAEGRGSREPVASNDSSWGRVLNQRIEFIRIP
jgi:outer membrane protein OmpA-like peptidoglycan-associated protein